MNAETIIARRIELENMRNARLAEIGRVRSQLEGLERTIYAIDGALEDCEYWLKKIEEEGEKQ